MNRDRFIEIINAYGTREANWPQEEVITMKAMLQQEDCQQLLNDMASLDDLLDTYESRAIANITPALMEQVGRDSWLDSFLNLLMPRQYGAFAASVVLAAGILIGALNPAEVTDTTNWDEEILSLSLEDVTHYE